MQVPSQNSQVETFYTSEKRRDQKKNRKNPLIFWRSTGVFYGQKNVRKTKNPREHSADNAASDAAKKYGFTHVG